MSRFPVCYLGNKRKEVEHILPAMRFEGLRRVVEPFCGSAAVSMELHSGGADVAYHINDLDTDLIGFYEAWRAVGLAAISEAFAAAASSEAEPGAAPQVRGAVAWLAQAAGKSHGRYSGRLKERKTMRVTKKHLEGEAFVRDPRVRITAGDWLACAQQYQEDAAACVYLDPPYFAAYNSGYTQQAGVSDPDGNERDRTRQTIDILNFIRDPRTRCRVVMSSSANAVISELFKDWIATTYDHAYGLSRVKKSDGTTCHRKSAHLVICKPEQARPASPVPAGDDDDCTDELVALVAAL